jgi:zinc protease
VGDLEPQEALASARQAFGKVPAREVAASVTVTEPRQEGERRATHIDPHAALPALHVVFKAPPRRHPDLLALSYAEKILGGGESSRLWRRLVKDEEKALSLSLSIDERRGPSLFRVFSILRPGTSLDELESDIRRGLQEFAAAGPTPAEMERARRMILSDAVRATQTTQSVAFVLSEYGLYDRDADLWREDFGALLDVTAAEVRDAAARTFVPLRATVVTVVPEGREA